MDSPLGNGNNFFMASPSSELWSIVQYDHNNIGQTLGSGLCASHCAARTVDWSIAEPTCGPLEENTIFGPLLGINDFYQTYLEYVEQFHSIFSDKALLMEMQQFGDAMGEALEAEKMSHIQHFMESNLTNPGSPSNFSSKCPVWKGVAISKCPQWLSGGTQCNQEPTAEDGLAICAEWSANAHDNECYRATVAAGVHKEFGVACSSLPESGAGLVVL